MAGLFWRKDTGAAAAADGVTVWDVDWESGAGSVVVNITTEPPELVVVVTTTTGPGSDGTGFGGATEELGVDCVAGAKEGTLELVTGELVGEEEEGEREGEEEEEEEEDEWALGMSEVALLVSSNAERTGTSSRC